MIGIINNWHPPKWHKDFGDPKKELEILKKVCNFIFEFDSSFKFELDCYEEGYLGVNLYKQKKLIGTVEVVELEEQKIGIFLEKGYEGYFNKVEDVKKHLFSDE